MRTRRFAHSFSVSRAILRTAAFLVPAQRREEWLAEWRSEHWYVWHACNGKPNGSYRKEPVKGDVVAFCLGAFKDGFWLRQNDLCSFIRRVFRLGSPARCVFFLTVLAVISLSLAFYLPGTRKALLPSPYRDADSLVMISRGGYSWAPFPTVQFSEYQPWTKRTDHLFTGVAFYQPIHKRVHIGRHQAVELSIARASDNLFELLQVPIGYGVPKRANRKYTAELVLSRETWRKYFGGDHRIIGHVLSLAGQPVLVAGVIGEDSWRLPGQMDAWLLESQQQMATLSPHTEGFVLANVRASDFIIPPDGEFHMTVTKADGGQDRYGCRTLAKQNQQPFSLFLFALTLACLCLPATTALPLGEYPTNSNQLLWTIRTRRWIFLLIKLALIIPIVYFVSVDLAYFSSSMNPVSSQYIQLGTSLPALLFAFRWALRDQRKRCPVCLRLLSNPARVGHSSRNFLAWNGTELICVQGHGLLHVPDISTSWFSTQRWLYLDSSWNGLFSDAYLGIL